MKENLVGKKFGKLTVIEQQRTECKCKCECGNKVNAKSYDLKKGRKKSCGCFRKEIGHNNLKDLTGQRFEKLQVIKRVENKKSRMAYWLCKCDCGNTKIVRGGHLTTGKIKSCGCLQKQVAGKFEHKKLINIGDKFNKLTVISYLGNSNYLCRCDCGNLKIADSYYLRNDITRNCGCSIKRYTIDLGIKKGSYKHGKYKTRLYSIYAAMKNRCFNKKARAYKYYGGRGITVCDEWKNDFMSFYNWAISNGYKDNLSIDRIDVNGNYEPNNCRWATYLQQANNTRKCVYIQYNDERHTISEWARILHIDKETMRERLRRHGITNKTFTIGYLNDKYKECLTYDGKSYVRV